MGARGCHYKIKARHIEYTVSSARGVHTLLVPCISRDPDGVVFSVSICRMLHLGLCSSKTLGVAFESDLEASELDCSK